MLQYKTTKLMLIAKIHTKRDINLTPQCISVGLCTAYLVSTYLMLLLSYTSLRG